MIKAVALLLISAASFSKAFSEISVPNPGHPDVIYILGKVAGPDPWPSFGTVLNTPLVRVLNPDGDIRGDRRPDLIFRQGSPPTVVWSYWDGSDFEIAYSEWNGSAWTPTLLLTDNAVDDIDPKIGLDVSGRPMVTWSRNGSPSVVLSTRRTGSGSWEAESQVSQASELAQTPVIALSSDGHARIGYEVASAPQRQVVVARDNRIQPEDPQGYYREIVATTPFSGDTQPVLDARQGLTFVTWVHSETLVGWSELRNGVWTVPGFEPYNGPDDVEAARFRIKNRLQP